MKTTLVAVIAVLAATLATSSVAEAKAHTSNHDLVVRYDCTSIKKPSVPPVKGYLIRDVKKPANLFYRDSGSLTQGYFVEYGGTWKLVYWCEK